MAVMHLSIKFGGNIFIQSGDTGIFRNLIRLPSWIFMLSEYGTFRRDVEQVLAPIAPWIKQQRCVMGVGMCFHESFVIARSYADGIVQLKYFTEKFYINMLRILCNFIFIHSKNCTAFFIHKTIIQYLSTADVDIFIRPFVRCATLLVMATTVEKILILYVRQMQRRRHHMTVHCLQLSIV